MKTLKLMALGVLLGAGVSNCEPDVENNYYSGSGITPSGAYREYTCRDAAESWGNCMSQPGWDDNKQIPSSYITQLADDCERLPDPQNCIDCVVSSPCDPKHKKSPFNFCEEECPL
ncbi:hypothetical protein HYT55_03335 [Candidatus Woesearchaeota archaeon]|nr:hypothetical protein [Candidatus Woesearchaeota archaeon]